MFKKIYNKYIVGDKMKFNEKLFTLRKRAGYSQEEFAEIIGVSRQTVSKWETDFMKPETDKLIQISKLYNVSLDELLIDENNILSLTNETVESENSGVVGIRIDETNQTDKNDKRKKSKLFKIAIGLTIASFVGLVLTMLISILLASDGDSTVVYSTTAISVDTIFYFFLAIFIIGLGIVLYKLINRILAKKKGKQKS